MGGVMHSLGAVCARRKVDRPRVPGPSAGEARAAADWCDHLQIPALTRRSSKAPYELRAHARDTASPTAALCRLGIGRQTYA
jgi:hypothetical protein